MNSQIQFETNGLRVLVLPVPENTLSCQVYDKESLPCALLIFTPHEYFEPGLPSPIPIPEGKWKYQCATDTMTDKEALYVLDKMGLGGLYLISSKFREPQPFLKDRLQTHYGINPNEKQVILIESK